MKIVSWLDRASIAIGGLAAVVMLISLFWLDLQLRQLELLTSMIAISVGTHNLCCYAKSKAMLMGTAHVEAGKWYQPWRLLSAAFSLAFIAFGLYWGFYGFSS